MEEIWKDIPGYEGLYIVSNLGNIKSLSKKISTGNGWYISKEKILSPGLDNNGYPLVVLAKDRKYTSIRVHRIVATTFLGVKPKLVCNHKDGNKSNNHICNLEWVTSRENNMHSRYILQNTTKKKVLSKTDIKEIKINKLSLTRFALSKKYNVSAKHIYRAVRD